MSYIEEKTKLGKTNCITNSKKKKKSSIKCDQTKYRKAIF